MSHDTLRIYASFSKVLNQKELPSGSEWFLLPSTESTLSFPNGERRRNAENIYHVTAFKDFLLIHIAQNGGEQNGYFILDSLGQIFSPDRFLRRKLKLREDKGTIVPDNFVSAASGLVTHIDQKRE